MGLDLHQVEKASSKEVPQSQPKDLKRTKLPFKPSLKRNNGEKDEDQIPDQFAEAAPPQTFKMTFLKDVPHQNLIFENMPCK